MPNKNDDPPANPPDPAQSGADPLVAGSPAAPGTGGSQPTEKLETVAMRRVQAMMDQNIALLEQGRTNEMNPKVVQLLARYDELTTGAAPTEGDDRGGYYPSQQPPPSRSGTPSKFEELGRQKARDDVITGIRSEVETDIVTELWAEDIRAFFAGHGDSLVSAEDFAPLDFSDKRRFPNTRAGYQAWRQAAKAYIETKSAGASTDGEPGAPEGEDAALAADRAKAQRPGQPNPVSTGGAGVDALRAAKLAKEGKMTNEQFMEVVRRNTTPGILSR